MAQDAATQTTAPSSISIARIGIYAAILLIGIAVVLIATAVPAPDLANAKWYESRHFRFSYPGNWQIDLSHPKYDADYNIYMEAPRSGWAHIRIYDSKISIEEELNASIEDMGSTMTDHVEGASFNNWGEHVGVGQSIQGNIRGRPHVLRIFIKRLNGEYTLEVSELFEEQKNELFDPAFELLRSSFTLR